MTILQLLLTLFAMNVHAGSAAESAPEISKKLNVEYSAPGGQRLHMDIFSPRSDTSTTRPALLLVHGGGWAAGRKEDFHGFAQYYAQHGYVTFCANYRLVKDGRNTWPAQLDDVQMAVRWIRAHAGEYGVVPDRLGAIGGSAGGHLVAMLGLRDTRTTAGVEYPEVSSRVNCVANWAGPSDLTIELPTSGPLGINVDKIRNDLLGASLRGAAEIARDASPLHWVHRGAPPMLVIHGDKDNVVPFSHAEMLVEALRKAGNEVELVVLENEGHGLTPANYQRMLKKTDEFFAKHLK